MAANTTKNAVVSVLLLGSGWTSKFVVPLLRAHNVSFARTRRNASASDGDGDGDNALQQPLSLTVDDAIDDVRCQHLPRASLVLVVFPLKRTLVERLVTAYEQGTGCSPAWLALGSTGAWSTCKGVCTSDTPVSAANERAQAEQELLDLHGGSVGGTQQQQRRRTAVLNLSGLYGAERNPCNFAKRACDTKDKLQGKTSLHLIHGIDVARAVLATYHSLADAGDTNEKLWGRRWMVTDGNVYDWWQLLSTLQPQPVTDGPAWVQALMKQHAIPSLPRPWPDSSDALTNYGDSASSAAPPHVMERVLDSTSFWSALGIRPSVGRCDDYSSSGGGGIGTSLIGSASQQGSL